MNSVTKITARTGVFGVAVLTASLAAHAGEGFTASVTPARGLTLDVGSKHTVSYFIPEGGVCNLTLMIADKANEDGEGSSVGARINTGIEAGKTARIETAEGKSLEFACAAGARSMQVRTLDVVAYSAPKR